MNRKGIAILAAVFLGLFAALAGLVAGTFLGAKSVSDKIQAFESTDQ